MLNWHPVVEYEIREIEFKQREIEHEQRMQQLRKENAREDELNAKIAALWPSSSSSSAPAPPPDGDSPT